jgi:23S rRNA (pseudouridine1915-N3)-methyltransferase
LRCKLEQVLVLGATCQDAAMKLAVIAVGKLKERHWVEACDEYLKRLRRYLPCEMVEVRSGAELLGRCPARHARWVLDERGRELTSEELARQLERRMTQGAAGIAFVIGGADGVPEDARNDAELTLALGRMTLAHRLARLVLLEQLYRALTIIRGEPYHRGQDPGS